MNSREDGNSTPKLFSDIERKPKWSASYAQLAGATVRGSLLHTFGDLVIK